MEDLIYVIILIAWVAYAFYRQSQKKKEAQRAPSTPRPASSDEEKPFKSLEEILFGGETTIPEPVFVEEDDEEAISLETEIEKTVSLEELYMQQLKEGPQKLASQRDLSKEKPILLEEVEDEEDRGEMMENWLAEFDLRKAVIYSEILRRPYD